MCKIKAQNLKVSYPVLGMDRFSLKKQVLNGLVGGRLNFQDDGKSYVDAIDDIDLTISTGEIVALVGHNGSGKTTLLRTIAGILPPTSGQITVNGKLSCLIDSGAGMDFEGTGIENIYLLAYTAGHRKSEIERNINGIIDFADLGNFINLPIRAYSAGMIARLAFSVATSFEYDVILMDEGMRQEIKGFLTEHQTELTTYTLALDA